MRCCTQQTPSPELRHCDTRDVEGTGENSIRGWRRSPHRPPATHSTTSHPAGPSSSSAKGTRALGLLGRRSRPQPSHWCWSKPALGSPGAPPAPSSSATRLCPAPQEGPAQGATAPSTGHFRQGHTSQGPPCPAFPGTIELEALGPPEIWVNPPPQDCTELQILTAEPSTPDWDLCSHNWGHWDHPDRDA